MWRRRRDPSYPSWSAYATGLTLVLVPSLLRAVTDAGNVRPLLLALAALAVLCSGLARRLQAPLVIGGLVLGIDAVVQLVPYLLAVYDAVPRWSLLAAIGLVLVLLGATYERRARELRALQRQIASFG
jgi:Kef-type K+ transport system membrane component KefB